MSPMATVGDSASSLIKQTNTQGAVVDASLDPSLSNGLKPGERVGHHDLAIISGVGTMPIRKALRQSQNCSPYALSASRTPTN